MVCVCWFGCVLIFVCICYVGFVGLFGLFGLFVVVCVYVWVFDVLVLFRCFVNVGCHGLWILCWVVGCLFGAGLFVVGCYCV